MSQDELRNLYRKELKNLKARIRTAENKGFLFDENIIPNKPEHITKKDINKLTSLRGVKLQRKGEFLVYETGEILTGKEGIKFLKTNKNIMPVEEQSYTSQTLLNFSQVVVDNFNSEIMHYPWEIAKPIVELVNQMVTQNGVDNVAYALEHTPHEFKEVLSHHAYDSDGAIHEYAMQLISYLPDVSDQYKRDLADAFDYNELGYEN